MRAFTIASACSLRDQAVVDQGLGVLLAHGRVGGDDLINLRLRESRLVALVVAVLPVANEIDQVIQLEALR
jgi:hypothetical protein